MTSNRVALVPLCLLLAAVVRGQVPLEPQPAPPGIRKLVVHDQGGLWPTAMATHLDGSVTAFGNPWLGGLSRPIVGLSGVSDLARLDAFLPGDTESVVVVGAGGLNTVRWDAAARGFTITPFVDPALAGAILVRAAAFAPHHLVSVVPADGLSVRCYRSTATYLSSIPVASPVRDLELFKHASGTVRQLIRTDSGLACHGLAGAQLWSLSGYGGVLVRWPQPATVRAAWLHRLTSGGDWQLTQIGDSGPLSTVSLAHAIGAGESLQAAFAADANADGAIDLVVKSSVGVSVLAVPPGGDFSQSFETSFEDLEPSAASVPDLVVTHGGRRLRYVDEFGAVGVRWDRVDLQQQLLVSNGDDLSLEVVPPTSVGNNPVGGIVDYSDLTQTVIKFDLRTTPQGLAPFVLPDSDTKFQIVAWVQDDFDQRGELDDLSESNLLLKLDNVPTVLQEDWLWESHVDLSPVCSDQGWGINRYYWLTIRLCSTSGTDDRLGRVSEPITLVTSMSGGLSQGQWSYLTTWYFDPAHVFPIVRNEPPNQNGGGVVGVVDRVNLPPPPPPGGIPTPRTNTGSGSIIGRPAGS